MAKRSRELKALGKELKALGKDIISLSLGQPDFDTPGYIKKAAIEAINKGYTSYTPVCGIPGLRQAIVNFYKKLFALNPGDEVILLAPYWVSYYPMVQLAGGKPVIYDTSEDDFNINIEKLEALISGKTKFIVLNSPNNPSGVIYDKATLEKVLKLTDKYPIYIVSDEIYHLITYDTEFYSCSKFSNYKDKVIIISGVGKAFAMTGWRIGFMIASL